MADNSIPDKSNLEKLLGAMTKLGDATLNAASKKIGIDTGVSQREIFDGKKNYTAREFLDDVGEKTGYDLKFGEDQTARDKTLNFAAEFAVSAVTDPLNLLTAGSTKIAKDIAKYANLSEKAVKTTARALTGATIGAVGGDTPSERIIGAIGGAGLGAVAPAAIRDAGTLFNESIGKPLVNSVAKMINPEAFRGTNLSYTDALDLSRQAEQRTQDITRLVREASSPLELDKLDDVTSKDVASFLDSKNSEWHTHRNNLESQAIADSIQLKMPAYRQDGDKITIGFIPSVTERGVKPKVKDVQITKDHMAFQDMKYKDKFGARHILDKDGDYYSLYTAYEGKPNFVLTAKSRDIRRVMPQSLRNRVMPVGKINNFADGDAIRYGITDSKGKALIKLTQEDLNLLSKRTNTYIGKLVDEQLAREANPTKTRLVKQWVERNRNMMKIYNDEQLRARGKDFIEVEPIDFHTLEVKPKLSGIKSYENITEGFIRRRSDEAIDTGGLRLSERATLENERFKTALYTKYEKEADRLLSNIKFVKPSTPVGERIYKYVEGFDKMTRFLKQQHLTFSHTWIVNNFVDNLSKAYMKGDLATAGDTLKLQSKVLFRDSTDPLVKDLLRLTDPNAIKAGVKFNDSLTEVAKKHGAINEGLFSETYGRGKISKEMLIAKVGLDEATKIIEETAKRTKVSEYMEKFGDFLASTVGRTGSTIEAAARLTTFKHHVDTITRSQEALNGLGIKLSTEDVANAMRLGYKQAAEAIPSLSKVFDEAARITNETFFDYANVSAFEQQVMKRIFPYWTYFSRNFPQWLEMIADNPSAFRNITRPYTQTGRAQTDIERKSTPDYNLDLAPRVVGDKLLTAPSFSAMDAINATTGDVDALSKVHPMLKLGYQLVFGKNEFGQELLPSNTKSGQVRVFGAAEKFAPFTDSIYRDPRYGNKQYTDSDLVQIAKTVQQNALPLPAIDTIAKALTKMQEGTTATDTLINLSPIKLNKIDMAEQIRVRMFRDREANLEKQKEMDIENAKRLSR